MTEQCSFCGHKNVNDKKIEYLYRNAEQFMVVKDVPCLECEFCGEHYFEAAVLKKIERDFYAIQNTEKRPLKTITVPVEAFEVS